MKGKSYRVPKYRVPPGAKVPDSDMKIIESMPVKSLITFPKTKGRHDLEMKDVKKVTALAEFTGCLGQA